MSDHEEKNVNQPEDEQFDFSSMSIDELIASTKEEIARIDEMMGTSRLPDAEEAAEELPQEDAPEAGEVSLDDGAQNPEEPKQQEPFEPKLPEEYADLSLDADEEPVGDDEAQRPRLAPGRGEERFRARTPERSACGSLDEPRIPRARRRSHEGNVRHGGCADRAKHTRP